MLSSPPVVFPVFLPIIRVPRSLEKSIVSCFCHLIALRQMEYVSSPLTEHTFALFLTHANHKNLMAPCEHLVTLGLGCLTNIFFYKSVSLLLSGSCISVTALPEKLLSHKMTVESIYCFLKAFCVLLFL